MNAQRAFCLASLVGVFGCGIARQEWRGPLSDLADSIATDRQVLHCEAIQGVFPVGREPFTACRGLRSDTSFLIATDAARTVIYVGRNWSPPTGRQLDSYQEVRARIEASLGSGRDAC